VDELNTRMRQAGYELHYHNGFIQRSVDPVVEDQIEQPFWDLVADATWKNVDLDMKEAIDLRDNGGRDPAFYAARALESTIKIVSDMKGWSHGGEKGAHNYIDNLGSQRADQFIKDWEANELKNFFTRIRNPLSHGPGSEEMPALSPEQTDKAIEFCMSWIKSLIRRMR
jgi:AbiJ N-terminal domain 4